MASIDKLLKYVNTKNVASLLDEDECKDIVQDVVTGYEIDDESRDMWLKTNKEAMAIVKNTDDGTDKNFPIEKASKVIYPLISPAIIQLASRLITQITRNDKVAECSVLGPDIQPDVDPTTGQPTGMGMKEAKAARVSDFMSFKLLIDSDTWLMDQHKLCYILAGWGMAFKKIYWDPASKDAVHELLPPEDVIINHETTSLEKCRRITIRRYMSRNDIITKQKTGHFTDFDIDELDITSNSSMDDESKQNDSREIQPVFEVLEQFCYRDLDDDDYEEPYIVFVHPASEKLLGMYTAFEVRDIQMEPDEETGKPTFMGITPRHGIIDYGLIDDPEGKFYKLGLNALLLHQNKALTHVVRSLLDAATLANIAGTSGFMTKSFKTKERSLRFKIGQFEPVDINPNLKLADQIMNLPIKEPSQVMLALLQFLVDTGEKTGFMTDILTGDAQTQNVPATTTLAMVEQSTRAFKPVVQKYFQSAKKEFKLQCYLYSQHLSKAEYFKFQDRTDQVVADDFNLDDLDIMPVADPTMSSEAHKYARLQAMVQYMQTNPGATNAQEATRRFYTELQFPQPQSLVNPPPPPQPNPEMMDIQLKTQIAQQNHEIAILKQQNAAIKLQLDARKVTDKEHNTLIKSAEVPDKKAKLYSDAMVNTAKAVVEHTKANIEQYKAHTDRIAVNKPTPPKSTNND